MVKEITSSEFTKEVSEGLVLVDFFSTTCTPCKILLPQLEQLSSEREDVKIVKVNIEESPDLTSNFGIMGVPTLLLFKNGEPVDKLVGNLPKEVVSQFINKHK